jgi:hypothetical protein
VGWLPFHRFVADAVACHEVMSGLFQVRRDLGSEMGGEMQKPIPRIGPIHSERPRCPIGWHLARLIEDGWSFRPLGLRK